MSNKKKQLLPEGMRKWLIGSFLGIVITPILIFSWGNIRGIWAAPEKIAVVEKKVVSHDEVQTQLSKLVLEQNARIEKNEELSELRAQNAKEQLALIADLKKYKK